MIRPLPLRDQLRPRALRSLSKQIANFDHLFWMQGSSRPEAPLTFASLLAGRARRSAFVVDPWKHVLNKIKLLARMQNLDPLFVPYKEAYDELKLRSPRLNCDWLPFAVDTDVFFPRQVEKDTFIYWMGRRYDPLHQAILAYCTKRGLKYVFTQRSGEYSDPAELGLAVSRAHYFVVTPPDIDNPSRTGGFSPLVMRYMEGLAAGSRLLGVLPKSGEYQALLPLDAILVVNADGSDLPARIDADQDDKTRFDAVTKASELVLAEHSWRRRADQIFARLGNGTIAFPL